jgi:hypothetical protein
MRIGKSAISYRTDRVAAVTRRWWAFALSQARPRYRTSAGRDLTANVVEQAFLESQLVPLTDRDSELSS